MLDTTFDTLADGSRLRLARLGSGPPLLLLHGYPDNLQIWCELAPRLADRFEVIAFDWPGMGYSDAWPGGATPTHMAQRLLRLLDHWDLASVTLIGMDMGAQPALAFAAQHPGRMRHLAVMNALVFGDDQTSWDIRILRQFGLNRRILRQFPWLVFRRAEWTFLPRGVRLPRRLRADLWRAFRRDTVRAFITKMCAGYQGTLPALPALYPAIQCPTLILWGERDRHFPPVHAQRLHRAIPSSRLHIVPRAEHWMAWYLAGELATQLKQLPERIYPISHA